MHDRMTRSVVIGLALVALVACGEDDDATTTTAPSSEAATATTKDATETTEAPTTTEDTPETTEPPTIVDPTLAIVESYAQSFASTDPRSALGMTAPGSPAYTYTEGYALLTEHATDTFPASSYRVIEGGFVIPESDNPRYSDFVVTTD